MKGLTDAGDGIHVLDSQYLRPGMAAIHLIVEAGRAALVDTGTRASLPAVQQALEALGLEGDALEWILLTHVHLDHAGGAGAMMQAFPRARLLVHPRGARHMADPARLWAGTVAVYGEDFAREMYGCLLPVEASRIVEMSDGILSGPGGRAIRVMDAPGHARHHLCFHDERSGAWFTGDCFGLSYREIHAGGRAFVFPTTTPVQFDPHAMHATIDRMMATSPPRMFLTHFGPVTEPGRLAADLHRLIDAFLAIAHASENLAGHAQQQAIRQGLASLLRQEAEAQGWAVQGEAAVALFAEDLELNAQGLQVWLKGRE